MKVVAKPGVFGGANCVHLIGNACILKGNHCKITKTRTNLLQISRALAYLGLFTYDKDNSDESVHIYAQIC